MIRISEPRSTARNAFLGVAATAMIAVGPAACAGTSGGSDGSGSQAQTLPEADEPVVIATRLKASRCTDAWTVDLDPRQIPDPLAGNDLSGWARGAGAVQQTSMQVEVKITGNGSATTIKAVRAVPVGDKTAPIQATTEAAIDCNAPSPGPHLEADLDQPKPKMTAYNNSSSRRLPLQVSTDTAEFLVLASTTKYDIYWQIEVDWTHDGKDGTTAVRGPDGQPFHLTAARATHTCVWGSNGKLSKALSVDCTR
ncbi:MULTISPECIES: hypothetical protein [Actinoplanes]|uniref:hypothetical protein n=1 Tax=Actinoplanes TaxID=1865 RepID=UPI0005F29E70|nr:MULTISPECIES: hypothetical protein [Actinoplanes]GLY00654.1 hypothetical protein Acsp01_10330 [Actinoplanes sp. NBRC 101535]